MSAVRISTLDATVLEEGRARRAAVLERIRGAAERAGRDPAEVTLVGVAKKQPTPRILSAIAAGVHVLGQSYIQEAREIRTEIESALAGDPAADGIRLEWRMVGRLQRNKAGLAARLFDAIESIDRVALVDTLARRVENEGRVLDVLLQVSLCGEPQKGGCEADDLPALIDRVDACESLRLRGLMTVPAASADPEEARPVSGVFGSSAIGSRPERPDATLDTISMGMSADLEVAVEEGATLVRVGTALFGERAQA